MPILPHDDAVAWSIIALATAGVMIRPFRISEPVWALAGAVALARTVSQASLSEEILDAVRAQVAELDES